MEEAFPTIIITLTCGLCWQTFEHAQCNISTFVVISVVLYILILLYPFLMQFNLTIIFTHKYNQTIDIHNKILANDISLRRKILANQNYAHIQNNCEKR